MLAAANVIEAGGQAALMAPTEILATQHYFYFKKLFAKLGYVAVLLTGSVRVQTPLQFPRPVHPGWMQLQLPRPNSFFKATKRFVCASFMAHLRAGPDWPRGEQVTEP